MRPGPGRGAGRREHHHLNLIIIITAHFVCRCRFLRMSELPCSFKWKELKVFLRQLSRRVPETGNDLHQEHYSINQYITLVKWQELIMKGVRRQRTRGFRLALIMSRMILMIILSQHYQHQDGRAFRPKNGGEHRKSSYDSFQMSARSRERAAPGALFN